MTILDLWSILGRIVENYPVQTNDYERPNTFAVLHNPSSINVDNFDKSKIYETIAANNNIFYSRNWEANNNNVNNIEVGFPAVIAFQNQFTGTNDLTKFAYQIDLYVIGRSESDTVVFERIDYIYERILVNVIKELFTYSKGSSTSYTDEWQPRSLFESDGNHTITANVGTMIKNRQNIVFNREPVNEYTNGLAGVSCRLELQGFDCTTVNFSY